MSITGIISEYNPFHKGHQKLIAMAKAKTPQTSIVAVMSGNITQRGAFPLLDKWTRSKLALQQGVDLVIELPTAFALNSAQYFAQGGVTLLHRLGCVDYISCGCEHQDKENLTKIAQLLQTPTLSPILTAHLKAGLSYPQAIAQGIQNLSTDLLISPEKLHAILKEPNSILALCYEQALQSLNSNIQLHLHPRQGVNHNDTKVYQGFASGSTIRQWVLNKDNWSQLKDVLPPYTYEVLQDNDPESYPQDMWIFNTLVYRLTMLKQDELVKIQNIREGLEYKLCKNTATASDLNSYILSIKSKRYTYTNLQRTLMYILLELTKEDMNEYLTAGPLYARVLAFNKRGQEVLKTIKQCTEIPLITKTTQYLNPKSPFQKNNLSTLEKMLALDCKTTDLFQLARQRNDLLQQDFYTSPIKL